VAPSPTPEPSPMPTVTPTPSNWIGPLPGKDPRFGAIQISELGVAGVANAADLGLTWSRELFYWDSLQSGLDLQRLQYTNRYIDLKTEVVGVIQFSPEYANRGRGGLYPPDNLNLAWDHPQNYWGSFMRALAAEKRGKVDKWIVWNEPDICQDWMDGFAWRGSIEDYYRLLKVAYRATKSANPDAQVIFGSLGIVHENCRFDGTETSFINRWLQVASQDPEAKANNWYFDAMSLNVHKEPERIQEMVERYKTLMRRYGFDKPIWLMEMSVPVKDGPIDPFQNAGLYATKEEQMSFLIQAIANAIVAGADRIGFYKMAFYPRSDPAYQTLKTAIKYMSYVDKAEKVPDVRGPAAYNYNGIIRIVMDGPGFRTTVVYNRSPRARMAEVPAIANRALLADKYGNETFIEAVDGVYRLELEGATALFKAPWGQDIYFVGGSPLLLREAM